MKPMLSAAALLASTALTTHADETVAKAAERLEVRVRLVAAARVPDPRAITPYKRALVADLYEVTEVLAGKASSKRILVARWAIRDGARLPASPPLRGWRRHRLVLEKFDDHKELAAEKLIVDSEEFDLPLYYKVP